MGARPRASADVQTASFRYPWGTDNVFPVCCFTICLSDKSMMIKAVLSNTAVVLFFFFVFFNPAHC